MKGYCVDRLFFIWVLLVSRYSLASLGGAQYVGLEGACAQRRISRLQTLLYLNAESAI